MSRYFFKVFKDYVWWPHKKLNQLNITSKKQAIHLPFFMGYGMNISKKHLRGKT